MSINIIFFTNKKYNILKKKLFLKKIIELKKIPCIFLNNLLYKKDNLPIINII